MEETQGLNSGSSASFVLCAHASGICFFSATVPGWNLLSSLFGRQLGHVLPRPAEIMPEEADLGGLQASRENPARRPAADPSGVTLPQP